LNLDKTISGTVLKIPVGFFATKHLSPNTVQAFIFPIVLFYDVPDLSKRIVVLPMKFCDFLQTSRVRLTSGW